MVTMVVGPEEAGVVGGRAGNGEALGPHELGEEGGDTGHTITRHAVSCTRRLHLLVHGEGEKASARLLDFV